MRTCGHQSGLEVSGMNEVAMEGKFVRMLTFFCCLILCFEAGACMAQTDARGLGVFEGQKDIGAVSPPGSAKLDAGRRTYSIEAAGANMWSTSDALHFVFKRVSGDVTITANMAFPSSAGNPSPHRKAVLMFRQTLDADGVYVDAAEHGSGMTALQYRRAPGATTQDIE